MGHFALFLGKQLKDLYHVRAQGLRTIFIMLERKDCAPHVTSYKRLEYGKTGYGQQFLMVQVFILKSSGIFCYKYDWIQWSVKLISKLIVPWLAIERQAQTQDDGFFYKLE